MRMSSALLAALLAPSALAQSYEPPRTPDGRPDFHGVWASPSVVAVERPRDVKSLTASEDEARDFIEQFWEEMEDVEDPDLAIANVRTLSRVNGSLRTSHLISPEDGRLPYTEAGQALALKGSDSSVGRNDNPEERPSYERCLAGFGQAPMRTFPILIPLQIVQTPDALALYTEDVAGFRTIQLDAPPQPSAIRTHEGWSSGRWEGDTLIVETTHLRADDHWRNDWGRPMVVEADSKIIERFRLISNDELLYQFTIEDDDLYTTPWLAEYSFHRHDGRVYEYTCHEGNYSIVNVLLAGRVADATIKAGSQK